MMPSILHKHHGDIAIVYIDERELLSKVSLIAGKWLRAKKS
jgi:hypothetical protein